MAQERRGSTKERDGKIYARVTYIDKNGKRREIWRVAKNRSQAKEIRKQLLRDLEDDGEAIFDGARMTFADLADYFKKHYVKDAEYVDGRKVSGLRGYKEVERALKTIKKHFGDRPLRSITYTDIAEYRAIRLKTPKKPLKGQTEGGQRSIATVNRELTYLRRALNLAVRQGWLKKNPFSVGDPLISVADEKKRERILTKEEEVKLLGACTEMRAHLKPIIICALDTGMRQGEIFKLKWRNIDFANKMINVEAFNTKTMQERQIAMTSRLERELWQLYQVSLDDPNSSVFGISDNVQRAFTGARKDSGLLDVRFHDLRHTAATRMISMGLPLQEVGRILGHTQANTTYRYVNADAGTARRAANALEEFQLQESKKEEKKEADELVN